MDVNFIICIAFYSQISLCLWVNIHTLNLIIISHKLTTNVFSYLQITTQYLVETIARKQVFLQLKTFLWLQLLQVRNILNSFGARDPRFLLSSIFDFCKQSLKQLLHPSTQPSVRTSAIVFQTPNTCFDNLYHFQNFHKF